MSYQTEDYPDRVEFLSFDDRPLQRRIDSVDAYTAGILERALEGLRPSVEEGAHLLTLRGNALSALVAAADRVRRDDVGDVVTYVVNRNVNWTNICYVGCKFCAFAHLKTSELAYDHPVENVIARIREGIERGATEVCMQGGIHPDYSGDTYLQIVRAVKRAAPQMHVHAFTPLEVAHGAETLGLTVRVFLQQLMQAGLNTLPGTAAEILDDEIRARICPGKVTTAEWLDIMQTAHALGLRSTATIMFGHVEAPRHWARHLLRIRTLQEKTQGFTELVPLPFVHMEAPVYRRGGARKGPTFREAVLMHAVARLVLNPWLTNIQVSWVKMGDAGVAACLAAGANDLGGTLMNETISHAAGTQHGQEMAPQAMDELIRACGRIPEQRTTLYGVPAAARVQGSYEAAALAALPTLAMPLRRRFTAAA